MKQFAEVNKSSFVRPLIGRHLGIPLHLEIIT